MIIRGRESKKDGIEILIIGILLNFLNIITYKLNLKNIIDIINHLEMRDLIENVEKGPEEDLGREGIEIDPENKGYHHNTTLNKFLFLFIME